MSTHLMPFGALWRDGTCTFRLWAPGVSQVLLRLAVAPLVEQQLCMQRSSTGWHELTCVAPIGTRYAYVLPQGTVVPDPASRSNPDGVHAASEVIDPERYRWHDVGWTGRPWHEAVICEIHIGTFTAAGTFRAAAERLADLAATGYTAVQLMPVAAFAGERGWGYDGVLLFAPHAAYGRADDLKAFVDRAHSLGLMVLLDVVYNHFGPEGNYLHLYAPDFFNPAHHTPWGAAINFDGDGSEVVRDFFRHNALYWIEEFHLDGLRLDAVHGMVDDSPLHIVADIASALRDGPGRSRQVHLVLENDHNQATLLERDAHGIPTSATAQWNDDFHHAAHVTLTGETDGYYADYTPAPTRHLARALAEGFAYQGEPSAHRGNRPRGESSGGLPSTSFVDFLQNHDQVGNRALGDRLSAPPQPLEAMYVCLLLSPHIPMLFMGEDFAASTPFLYFCDFRGDLAEAVSTGRRAEFARFDAFRDEAARAAIAEPNAPETFQRSTLRWLERSTAPHADRLAFIRNLLELRHEHLIPRLQGPRLGGGGGDADDGFLRVCWRLPDGSLWRLFANFGEQEHAVPLCAGTSVQERGVRRDAGVITFAAGATLVCVADEPLAA